MSDPFLVANLDEVRRAFRRTRDEVSVGAKKELKAFARPVELAAEALAVSQISGVSREKTPPTWAAMRTGVLQRAVYIAPVNRGVKGGLRASKRRPQFKTTLMNRAMRPAARRNEALLIRRYRAMLSRAASRFGRA